MAENRNALDGLFGNVVLYVNGAELPIRKALDFLGEWEIEVEEDRITITKPEGGAGSASDLTVDNSGFSTLTAEQAQALFDEIDGLLTDAAELLDGVDADDVDYDATGHAVITGSTVQAVVTNVDANLAPLLVGWSTSGSVAAAGGTRTLTLAAVATGRRRKYKVEIETRTGSTYDYYEAVVISRNVSGTVADPVPVAEITLPFVNSDYVVTFPISSSQVVVTLTNTHGSTAIDNATIKVTWTDEANP